MKLEVRCCCQPQKLLGWLEFSHSGPRDQPPPQVNIARPVSVYSFAPPEVVALPVACISIGGRRHYAIKAEGMTVEDLRGLPGFKEA